MAKTSGGNRKKGVPKTSTPGGGATGGGGISKEEYEKYRELYTQEHNLQEELTFKWSLGDVRGLIIGKTNPDTGEVFNANDEYTYATVRAYTDSSYHVMNMALWGRDKMSPAKDLQIKLTSRALNAMPTYKGKRAFRGVPEDTHKTWNKVLKSGVGGTISFKGYSSFSENIHKAYSWKGGKFSSPSSYLITVRNPKKGKAIKNISRYEAEKEVLWDAGSSFKIVRINKKRRVVVVEEI